MKLTRRGQMAQLPASTCLRSCRRAARQHSQDGIVVLRCVQAGWFGAGGIRDHTVEPKLTAGFCGLSAGR